MLNEGKVVESGKKYHIIPLQQLEAKSQEKGCQVDQLKAARRLGRQYNVQSEKDICLYMDTGLHQRLFNKHNQFFMAFLHPYNRHGNILLVPDDVWLVILMFLSKYIDRHAEKLRPAFVRHEGKAELKVIEQCTSVE